MPPTEEQLAQKHVIVACPVSTCEVRHVAGVGVLLAVRYIERAEQFETGEHTFLQALIEPEQALEIGEALKKSVQALELGKALKKALKKSAKKPAKRTKVVETPMMLLPAPACDVPALTDPISA